MGSLLSKASNLTQSSHPESVEGRGFVSAPFLILRQAQDEERCVRLLAGQRAAEQLTRQSARMLVLFQHQLAGDDRSQHAIRILLQAL